MRPYICEAPDEEKAFQHQNEQDRDPHKQLFKIPVVLVKKEKTGAGSAGGAVNVHRRLGILCSQKINAGSAALGYHQGDAVCRIFGSGQFRLKIQTVAVIQADRRCDLCTGIIVGQIREIGNILQS